MLIYLAHPIDLADEYGREVQDWLRVALSEIGVIFDPGLAGLAATGTAPTPRLQQINIEVMQKCDITVVFLPDEVPTIGTILELDRCIRETDYKPILVVAGDNIADKSWALSYLINLDLNARTRVVQVSALKQEWKGIKAWLSGSPE